MSNHSAAQSQRQTIAHAQPQSKNATEQVLDESLPPILQDLLNATDVHARSKLRPADKYRLLKSQIAPGCTDDELAVFLEVAALRNLSPWAKQIYAIRRKSRAQDDRGQWVDVWKMTIQTGIDGFRLIASRKDPGYTTDDTVFEYDDKAKGPTNPLGIVKATVRIWKTGASRPVEASAFWDEYRQAIEDRNGGGKKLTGKWADMPRNQLGKCAEALALRKAFPEDLSGIYTDDEMDQADNDRSVEALMPHVVAQTNSATPSMRGTKPASTDYTALVADLKKITKAADAIAWTGKPEIKTRMGKLSDAEYDKLADDWRAHVDSLEAAEKKPAAPAATNSRTPEPSTAEESAMAGGGQ